MYFYCRTISTILIISACIKVSSAAYLKAPENVAVVSGERVVLQCENIDTPGAALGWRVVWSNGTENTIVACNTPSNILEGYELELPIGSACNLIIPSVTTSQAGQYRCFSQINVTDDATSQVIVLESAPQCQTEPSGIANVSDTVMMSCSVSCHGKTDTGPVMTWFDPTGLEVSASNTGSSLSPNYVTLVSASIPTVQSYTCNTRFNSTPQSSGNNPATNIPTYTSTCMTLPLSVLYPPYRKNITITPRCTCELHLGSTLTCNATTVPPVTRYQWMNESDEIISNSAVLTLDQIGENLEYTCTVWNELGSNMISVIVNVIQVPGI